MKKEEFNTLAMKNTPIPAEVMAHVYDGLKTETQPSYGAFPASGKRPVVNPKGSPNDER